MNKKGFTLIELLATIVIIAVVAVIVAPYVIESYDSSKEKAYNILVSNIKLAGENYFNECEYGDLKESDKYGDLACSITSDPNGDYAEVTLGALAKLGLLKGSAEGKNNTEETVTFEYKKVNNPKTGDNISECKIKIIKNVQSNKKTVYTIEKLGSDPDGVVCPSY